MRPPVTQATVIKAITEAGKLGITASEVRKQTRLGRTLVSVTLARLLGKEKVFSYGAATRMRYFISEAFRDAAKTLMDAQEAQWQAERRSREAAELIAREERRLGKRVVTQPPRKSPLEIFSAGWHRKAKTQDEEETEGA
jgi:hypothetical protein